MKNIVDLLLDNFGQDRVKTTPDFLEKYGRDWYEGYDPNPSAIFFPTNELDIAEIMHLAASDNFKLVASGGRTGLNGGATATEKEVIISSEKLNKIKWLPETSQILCQAGVTTDVAKKLAVEHGRHLPIEFSSTSASTIGGNVATNAAGAKFIKYGATKQHVKGLKVVLPNSEIIELTKNVEKDASGPNLMELFFGSEGTMGFITEILLDTYPLPKFKESVLFSTNNLDVFDETFIKNSEIISALELLDNKCMNLLAKDSKHNFNVLLELVADNENDIASLLAKAAKLQVDVNLLNTRQAQEFWHDREKVPVLLSEKKAYKLDICVPVSSLVSFMNELQEIETNKDIFCFGHLGDGNIHVNLVDSSNKMPVIDEIYELTKKFNGSPSAEHGIGIRKKHVWHDFSGYKDKYKLLKSLKKSMDPDNILGSKVFFD